MNSSQRFDRKSHWGNVYENKSTSKVSWFQEDPQLSMRLIRSTRLPLEAPIIDVGGGASSLVDSLHKDGFTDISVLDLSVKALSIAKKRLAEKAHAVEWFEKDVTQFKPKRQYALWHDRAVFHFLTLKTDRERYVNVLKNALLPGGHLIIMTFAIGGPEKCSGLDIVQCDVGLLKKVLGKQFLLIESGKEMHVTPSGGEQKFAYFHFEKRSCKLPVK